MVTFDISKGEGFNISKEVPQLKKLRLALRWQPKNISSDAPDIDVDGSVFLLGDNGKALNSGIPRMTRSGCGQLPQSFVCYLNLESHDKSVKHHGDNLVGAKDGDAESIDINLDEVQFEVKELLIHATIYDNGHPIKHDFSDINGASIALVNAETGQEIARSKPIIVGQNKLGTCLVFGSLKRTNNGWVYDHKEEYTQDRIQSMINKYMA